MSGFRISAALWDRIHHFASFPQTGVSLQQMVLFGQNPSQGTLFKASQFLVELDQLPHSLSDMPSINKVKNWYAQSFEELITFPKYVPSPAVKKILYASNGEPAHKLPQSTPNPSLFEPGNPNSAFYAPVPSGNQSYLGNSGNKNGNGQGQTNGLGNSAPRLRIPIERRYFDHAAATASDAAWPPELHAYNASFTRTLEAIKRRHDPTVTTVAQGVLEWKASPHCGTRHIGLDVQAWLDRFYMSRIGIRFLIGQHIALNTLEPHPDYVGIICTRANVHDIVHEAIENARFVCEEHYGMFQGPPVQLICAPQLNFAYVPGHLSHICFELLKNSLRAVVERFGAGDADKLPPIKVVVSEGREDITIKISDEGGGIPRSAIALIWTYMYTTMTGQGLEEDFTDTDFKAPMAGFGYGLPLSRLYARYFGGDLKLISMEGYGTDVYIHLNRLSSSREPLQ
ncbi:alpha-ketoacid dehydrogenase kinase [Phellopilus nigrolimitatus]|nr:alpha-ketoacid dehydrogenase kinase [Phellopilus nigrolimitatus]